MEFVYNDGGRSKYFQAKNVGDCVTRAICNATGKDYKEVYTRLKQLAKEETSRQCLKHRGGKRSSVRNGVFKETWKKYLDEIGWVHISTMGIGEKERVHLHENELPSNQTIIVQVSKHLTCVKDGVIYDTYDCSRDGERMVYGYWRQPTEDEIKEKEIAKRNQELEKAIKDKMKKEMKKVKDTYNKKIKELEKSRDKKLKEIEKKYADKLMGEMLNENTTRNY